MTRIIGDERNAESSISYLLNNKVVTTIPVSSVISQAAFFTLFFNSLSTDPEPFYPLNNLNLKSFFARD